MTLPWGRKPYRPAAIVHRRPPVGAWPRSGVPSACHRARSAGVANRTGAALAASMLAAEDGVTTNVRRVLMKAVNALGVPGLKIDALYSTLRNSIGVSSAAAGAPASAQRAAIARATSGADPDPLVTPSVR